MEDGSGVMGGCAGKRSGVGRTVRIVVVCEAGREWQAKGRREAQHGLAGSPGPRRGVGRCRSYGFRWIGFGCRNSSSGFQPQGEQGIRYTIRLRLYQALVPFQLSFVVCAACTRKPRRILIWRSLRLYVFGLWLSRRFLVSSFNFYIHVHVRNPYPTVHRSVHIVDVVSHDFPIKY